MAINRSDETIRKDVENELFWDSRIDEKHIDVSVENGAVTLSGRVPSYFQVNAARRAAWRMPGVTTVVDRLSVSYISPPAIPSDTDLQERAHNVLAWDPAVDESETDVIVSGGVATVNGTVDAFWKKAHVGDRIAGLHGVMGVENKLAIVPTHDLEDEVIAEDIVGALDRDVLVDADDVTVAVSEGVAQLTGKVPTWSARRAAEEDASMTRGVVGVKDHLEILV